MKQKKKLFNLHNNVFTKYHEQKKKEKKKKIIIQSGKNLLFKSTIYRMRHKFLIKVFNQKHVNI